MTSLRALLEARLAFDGNYFVGTEFRVGGARENKRLKPIHDALIELVDAMEFYSNRESWRSDNTYDPDRVVIAEVDFEHSNEHGVTGGKRARAALANLEKLLKEGTDD